MLCLRSKLLVAGLLLVIAAMAVIEHNLGTMASNVLCKYAKDLSAKYSHVLKKHKESLFFLGFFVLFGFSLFAGLRFRAIDVVSVRPWLELVNGATWPNEWFKTYEANRDLFLIAVAVRTTLNLAAPIGVIGTVFWVLYGGFERFVMKMSKIELLKMHNVELVHRLANVLNQRHPNVLNSDDLDAMELAADEFTTHWVKVEPLAVDIAREEISASGKTEG